MKQYKGLYIDNVYFNNTADIDQFLKEKAVQSYKTAVELFAHRKSMEYAIYVDECAERLVNQFGYTWEQVEAIEASAYQVGA